LRGGFVHLLLTICCSSSAAHVSAAHVHLHADREMPCETSLAMTVSTPRAVGAMRRGLLRLLVFALPAASAAAPARAQSSSGSLAIGIIGAGNIGGTLAALWVKAGHRVMLSSRHPEKLRPLARELGPLASVGTPSEAAAFGDAVLIAIPYGSYPELGRSIGRALEGKVVLDAGNPTSSRGPQLAAEARANGIGPTSRKYLGYPRLVRAFSNLSSGVLAREANRPPPRLGMPILGDDGVALALASRLVSDAGFDPVIIGTLDRAEDTAMGGSLSGVQASAAELRGQLGLERRP
jgi:predicted dinucleotide-binding enzyme